MYSIGLIVHRQISAEIFRTRCRMLTFFTPGRSQTTFPAISIEFFAPSIACQDLEANHVHVAQVFATGSERNMRRGDKCVGDPMKVCYR